MVVQRALAGLPGIAQAAVSFEDGVARVRYDPSAVSVERMVQAIGAVGFAARPVAEP